MSSEEMCGPRADSWPTSFFFDTSVYIAYIRRKEYSELVDRATESGRVVLSSVVTMGSTQEPVPWRKSACWISSSNP